jgi:hypothetical protein
MCLSCPHKPLHRPPEQLLELLGGLQQVVALLAQQRTMLAEQQVRNILSNHSIFRANTWRNVRRAAS